MEFAASASRSYTGLVPSCRSMKRRTKPVPPSMSTTGTLIVQSKVPGFKRSMLSSELSQCWLVYTIRASTYL
jgi:hypothetical protein